MIEQGTHGALLSNPDGAYYALVNAQQLSMGESLTDESELIQPSMNEIVPVSSGTAESLTAKENTVWQAKGLFRSFGLFLYEQRGLWLWYLLLIIGCMGAGAAWPIQAWMFAQLISVFALTGQALVSARDYWSLRFLFLAIATGVSYFILGWAAQTVTMVSHLSSSQGLAEYSTFPIL